MTILAYRLVRIIETHADRLAHTLLECIQQSDRACDYRIKVSGEELESLVREVYKDLGRWLLTKTEVDIEHRYMGIGALRAQQGVPLSQVIWCIALVKENLWHYFAANDLLQEPAEVFGELQMFQLLDEFIDRAMYYAAVGYERARGAPAADR